MGASISRIDPIALIEEAYAHAESHAAWLRRHGPAIAATFDVDDLGVCSYFMRGGVPEDVAWHAGSRDVAPDTVQRMIGVAYARATPDQLRRTLLAVRTPGVHTLYETIGGVVEESAVLLPFRVADSPAVMVPTAEDRIAVVATLTHEPLPIDDETRALWERIALHLAAACRLSGREPGPEASDVEAVLDPDGRVKHAAGPAKAAHAREQLRAAVRRIDAARTRAGRADPMKALDLWHGLLAGRWSLVDHFDGDGRRFLLARRNDPDSPHTGALSRRQRQVVFYASVGWSHKQIGFALGLTESTVSRHLSAALEKLGLGSRADLVRVTAELALAAATGGAPAAG